MVDQRAEAPAGGLILPFITSTERTLRTMLGMAANRFTVYQGRGISDIYEVSAIIGLGGESKGAVILSCPYPVARSFTAQLLGEEEADDEQSMADTLGELVNVIAGAAKPDLRQLGYQGLNLSLPTVVLGGGHRVFRKRGVHSWLAIFDSNVGRFSLQVYLGEEPGTS